MTGRVDWAPYEYYYLSKEVVVARSTITSKGQTTVPMEIRRKLGLGPGDVLHWELAEGAVRVVPGERAFLRFRGSIRVGRGSAVEDVRRARSRRGTETG